MADQNSLRGNILCIIVAAAMLLSNGCVTRRQTDPARTATEQLLLSTATDRAVREMSLDQFAHKKVYLDPTYLDSYDVKYVLGTIRDALSSAGALLAADSKSSEITIEARSGALSTDDQVCFVGIPALPVPISLLQTISTPELDLYKSSKQYSTAKFVLLAYETQSREHLYSSGPMVGRAHNNYYSIIFVGFHRTDIPEMQKKKKN